MEVKWVPAESWFVQAGLGYLDTEIVDDGGLTTVLAGSNLNQTPEVTFNGLIVKDFQIGDGNLSVQTDFQYTDEHNSTLNGDPEGRIESAFFINARAAYTFGNEQQHLRRHD